MKQLTSNSLTLVLVLIMIAGVAVRLIHITQPLLEFFPQRQTQTAEITRNIYVNGWPDFWTPKVRYFTDGQPIPYVLEFPLYNGIVAVLYYLFGPNVIWGRLASLAFFVASSIVFYKLLFRTGPDFSSEKSAGTPEPRSRDTMTRGCKPREWQAYCWGPLLFFIFSPLHILVSRSFQPEELALFLLLLAVYKQSWLIFSLAVLTKLPLALFAPVMFFSPSFRASEARREIQRSDLDRPAKSGTRSLCFARDDFVKFGLSLLPSIVWYYRASRLTTHPAIARNFDLTNWFQPQLWFQPRWYFSIFQIEHVWVLTTIGLLFFWLGFWRLVRKHNTPVFWLVWLGSGLLYLSIFNYHAMTHEYYHLLLLPPLAVIAGISPGSIYSDISKHWSKLIFSVGIIIMITVSLSFPAIRKIISAPTSPEESTEITADRYRLIEDF